MPRNRKNSAPRSGNKSGALVNRLKPNQTPEAALAEIAVAGLVVNALTTREWSPLWLGDVDLTACLAALKESTRRANQGDLAEAEALLLAQAVTLNAIFAALVSRAQANMGQYLDAADRYMRLALKAQSQCRATLETLAVIKNPPTVFARQANIAHGPQQVNNGVPRARADDSESAPSKLLEAYGERMDARTAGATSHRDQSLAAVGTLDGAPHATG